MIGGRTWQRIDDGYTSGQVTLSILLLSMNQEWVSISIRNHWGQGVDVLHSSPALTRSVFAIITTPALSIIMLSDSCCYLISFINHETTTIFVLWGRPLSKPLANKHITDYCFPLFLSFITNDPSPVRHMTRRREPIAICTKNNGAKRNLSHQYWSP